MRGWRRWLVALAVCVVAIPPLIWAASWRSPLRIGSTFECGEAPLGLYQGQIVFYDWVASRNGIYVTHGDYGGVWRFLSIKLGLLPTCPT